MPDKVQTSNYTIFQRRAPAHNVLPAQYFKYSIFQKRSPAHNVLLAPTWGSPAPPRRLSGGSFHLWRRSHSRLCRGAQVNTMRNDNNNDKEKDVAKETDTLPQSRLHSKANPLEAMIDHRVWQSQVTHKPTSPPSALASHSSTTQRSAPLSACAWYESSLSAFISLSSSSSLSACAWYVRVFTIVASSLTPWLFLYHHHIGISLSLLLPLLHASWFLNHAIFFTNHP